MGKIHFLGNKFGFIMCLKEIFLGTTKFGGRKTIREVTAPEYPLMATRLLLTLRCTNNNTNNLSALSRYFALSLCTSLGCADEGSPNQYLLE